MSFLRKVCIWDGNHDVGLKGGISEQEVQWLLKLKPESSCDCICNQWVSYWDTENVCVWGCDPLYSLLSAFKDKEMKSG